MRTFRSCLLSATGCDHPAAGSGAHTAGSFFSRGTMNDARGSQVTLDEMMNRARSQGGVLRSVYDDAPEIDRRSLKTRLEEFHRANPEVYLELLKLARKARRGGMEKVSIKMLYEVVRWHRLLETTDKVYKLNNNWHALYARKLMKEHPELKGLFDTRERKGTDG